MQRVTHQAEDMSGARRGDRPALMLMTLPIAALLWLVIIVAAFELFKWATTA
jgi:hypothetical protein